MKETQERELSPLGLETKFVPVAEFGETTDGGTVSGYASIFNQPDQSGDVVLPGAFHRSLEELSKAGRRVRSMTSPVGVWRC